MQEAVIEGYRLSPQQRRIWLLQRNDPDLPFRAGCIISVEGPLDKRLLKAALQDVVSRHEILRTSFNSLPDMMLPVQVISDGGGPSGDEHDLTGCESHEQAARIESLFFEGMRRRLGFERGALLHVSLAALSDDRHALIISLPALCADAHTLRNLMREISRSYESLSGEGEIMQYADLSEWQNQILDTDDNEAERQYWREHDVRGFLDVKLPFKKRTSGESQFQPRFVASVIDPEQLARIDEVARKHSCSTAVFLLAGWQVLLWRTSGQSEIVTGAACDGRTYEGLDEALGPLAKYLPVRCHLERRLPFVEVLRQTNKSVYENSQHQEYFNWDQVGEAGRQAFFPFCFDYEELTARHSAGGVTFSVDRLYACTDRYGLRLNAARTGDSLALEFHYDASLFSGEEIERLSEEFLVMVGSIVESPECAIGKLDFLTPSQRLQVLGQFNRTAADYPADGCFQELFRLQAERTPDNVAMTFERQSLSYGELNARANQLAHRLRKMGVGPETRVAICIEHSPGAVIGVLGILKAGGAYVPLDPAHPAERVAFMLKDAGAAVLVTERALAENLPALPARTVCLDSDWEVIARESCENPASGARADNLAYVIYTSGSTGQPKGTMVEHGSLVNYLFWVNGTLLGHPPPDLPLTTGLTFDASLKQMFAPLLRGDEVWGLPPEIVGDPISLWRSLSARGKVAFNCVPSVWKLILDGIESGQVAASAQNLTHLFIGGERFDEGLVTRSLAKFPQLQIWNLYGPTELTANASAARLTPDDSVVIGRPIANTQIYLLDEDLEPVPFWAAGELHIGGDGLARGYLNRPDTTAERFIPNPFSRKSGDRIYKTGDLARYRPDGNIEFLGRLDDQVKIRGIRIELGEIEKALAQHAAVQQAVVLALEDEAGQLYLAAYVVPDGGRTITTDDLRGFLKEKLPSYMAPSTFVIQKALPLMPNGKIDRKALPPPDRVAQKQESSSVAPRTPIEDAIASLCAEILGRERIGVYDNFFDLGGHSLMATQVISRIRGIFQVDVSLRNFFEVPTIAGLSQIVVDKEAKPGQAEKIAMLLKSIEVMPDEEAGKLLQGRGNSGR